ncbi:hypothetical protein D3C78_1140580 [compost metagenome]
MQIRIVIIAGAQAFFVNGFVIWRQPLGKVVRVIALGSPMRGRFIIEVQVQVAVQCGLGAIAWGGLQVQWLLLQQYRGGIDGFQRLMVIVGCITEKCVAMGLGGGLVTPCLQCIGRRGRARLVWLATAFEAGQFLVQVEFVEGLRCGCPVLRLGG